ncbi:hypothetical protein BH20ACT2_BH20ACT2_08790 [soil metagenome]
MTITEQERHDLHTWMIEAMGEDRAATLMGHLPPVGWADVATKADLGATADRLLGEMHREFASMTKTILVAVVSALVAMFVAAAGTVTTVLITTS